MAQLAVAGAGALASSAMGLGWQSGWLVGSALGGALFGAKGRGGDTVSEGPRLADLTVTSSAYGAAIPVGYGTLRMAGNIIWSSGIRENRSERTVNTGGKGGGGPRQTIVAYTYYASFALAFAAGPAGDVLRIWADGKLIFDKRDPGARIARSDFRMRFYPGDETQLPDPAIAASVGADNAVAHRGLCYAVFEDLALGDFGNRIPNITAEITFQSTPLMPSSELQAASGPVPSYVTDELAVDWRRGYGYLLNTGADPDLAGIRRFNLRTLQEDRQARMSDVSSVDDSRDRPSTLFCGRDSHLYMTVGIGNARPIIRVDPDALREVGRFGFYSSGLSNTDTRFVMTLWFGSITVQGLLGRREFLMCGSIFSDVGVLLCSDMSCIWGAGETLESGRVNGMVGGMTGPPGQAAVGEGWVLEGGGPGSTHTTCGICKITATVAVSAFGGELMGAGMSRVASIAPGEIAAGATAFLGQHKGLVYDETDNSVIFQVEMDTPDGIQACALKWREGSGIVWTTPVPGMLNRDGPFMNASRIRGHRYAYMYGSRLIQLDTVSGARLPEQSWPAQIGGFCHYDSVSDSVIVRPNVSPPTRIYLNRGSGEGATVGAIVSDLCQRAGLAPADVDASEITDVVPGFVVARPSTARAAIEPLAQAFFFDGVESDDQLTFRARGRAPVATLNADLLIPLDARTGEVWREQRGQDVELPERVTVIHMDAAADYQQGSQSHKRVSQPQPTMFSRNQVTLELPMALTSNAAKSIAARALYAAWIERSRFEAHLPSDDLRLDPTDVVDVVLRSGVAHRLRLERVDIGGDYTIALRAVSQEAASYTAALEADGGSGRPPQVIAGDPATQLFVPDLPLLRDVDATGGLAGRVYAMAGGFGAPGWPGAVIHRSADGINWSVVARAGTEVAWGAAATALGAPASVAVTDEINALEVFMTTGGDRLESVTQAAMLNGANAALLLKANGDPEILQFRDVEPLETGAFRLTGLIRGRRGTDIFCAGHQAGETFILLQAATVTPLTVALGDLGLLRSWRGVGVGGIFDDADSLGVTHTGRDLKPYAVAQPTAALAGVDILLAWVRRTRIGGDWKDGTGTVPLAEAAESYEVDILGGSGAVLRTLTSSAPSVTYTAAQITADLGTMPTTLSVVIYQISDAIGRGFPRAVTLEIVP
ncbi:phage tail protein [Meridianimarinicoccus sp. RP-17]|uniref:phage tail protein n=1 Tax=Meridianimarinicoccus zhengii TaxID=2056810 RepID=UPI000DAE13FF|nr:phage tail protein [Phycocomes zhengii]